MHPRFLVRIEQRNCLNSSKKEAVKEKKKRLAAAVPLFKVNFKHNQRQTELDRTGFKVKQISKAALADLGDKKVVKARRKQSWLADKASTNKSRNLTTLDYIIPRNMSKPFSLHA